MSDNIYDPDDFKTELKAFTGELVSIIIDYKALAEDINSDGQLKASIEQLNEMKTQVLDVDAAVEDLDLRILTSKDIDALVAEIPAENNQELLCGAAFLRQNPDIMPELAGQLTSMQTAYGALGAIPISQQFSKQILNGASEEINEDLLVEFDGRATDLMGRAQDASDSLNHYMESVGLDGLEGQAELEQCLASEHSVVPVLAQPDMPKI